jgi:hypothetical protein
LLLTGQENNGIVLVNLQTKRVTKSFTAGSATITQVDLTEDSVISQTETQTNRLREPDGIVWLNTRYLATADEGDLNGGSRGFTIFDSTTGSIVYTSGNDLEHITARLGHYPESRSENKGSEPENVAFGVFGEDSLLFVNSERSSVVFVYDVSNVFAPQLVQVLPAGTAPEGGVTIPSRNLVAVASEDDDRGVYRGVVTIYQRGFAKAYPTLESADRANGTPIPWGAMSGLAAEIRGGLDGSILYSVEDSVYKKSRMFVIDTSQKPALLTNEFRLLDSGDKLKSAELGASLVNSDKTVNLDLEGIAVSKEGGFWICSEGAGTVGDPARPITSRNYLLKVSSTGVIEEVVTLPADVNAKQVRFGFEGCAEGVGAFATSVVVAFQRAWIGEANPRLGVYNWETKNWTFYFYPLDSVASQNGGWLGLSDIAPLGTGGEFLVLERDNQGGPDAAIKRIYKIDLTGVAPGQTVTKELVRDILPDLKETRGLVLEKIEGLAVTKTGDVWIISDNDGVDGSNGETELLKVETLSTRASFPAIGSGTRLTVVHINDHHSHFDEQSIDLGASNIPPGLSINTGSLRVFYGMHSFCPMNIFCSFKCTLTEARFYHRWLRPLRYSHEGFHCRGGG